MTAINNLILFGLFIINRQYVLGETLPETIQTTGGTVQGQRFNTTNGNNYVRYRVPFAQPPIGNLRFKEPVPMEPWNGTLDGTEDVPICVQGSNPVTGTEDCLYLTVYRPDVSENTSLPIMIYIPGGGFISGSASYDAQKPEYLLEEGVIVVIINYRLGIFGFLSTNDTVAPGNIGLKDQIMAIKWVNENAPNFGGQPNNITLCGQSAGGASIAYILLSPKADGLYQKAIIQSGVSLSLWAYSKHARDVAFRTGETCGISTEDSQKLIDGLIKVDAVTLQEASSKAGKTQMLLTPREGIPFAPVIEPVHDNALITDKMYTLLQTGRFNKVPTIIGFNSLEVLIPASVAFRLFLTRLEIPSQLVPADMNISPLKKVVVGTKIKLHYFPLGIATLSDCDKLNYVSDDQFERPIQEYARLLSKNNNNTFFYKFSYQGNLGGVVDRPCPGVGHTEELGYLWVSNHTATEADIITRNRMVTMWTNFVKFGNPTPNEDPILENVEWLPIDGSNAEKQKYLEIGDHLNLKTNDDDKDLSFWRGLYKEYSTPPYDTF